MVPRVTEGVHCNTSHVIDPPDFNPLLTVSLYRVYVSSDTSTHNTHVSALITLCLSMLADTKELVPIPGCILTCSLSPHPTLAKASHLLPPHTLVSMDDPLPGLIPTKAVEGEWVVVWAYVSTLTLSTQY